ncbi:hypothetical protein BV22DRAFT_320608 [Leucogyrophana mollusca]|uniref:Uncharacterized protein n=1 Tax=Leucogyrophana mollusca TaxID=85980 RepID=A0ACB8BNY5_9AGAM|nr:hypothetical protein BV22DRAFT_320608 [Leucogyrophana mollusca]
MEREVSWFLAPPPRILHARSPSHLLCTVTITKDHTTHDRGWGIRYATITHKLSTSTPISTSTSTSTSASTPISTSTLECLSTHPLPTVPLNPYAHDGGVPVSQSVI